MKSSIGFGSAEQSTQEAYWKVSALAFVFLVLLTISVMGSAFGVVVSTFENRQQLAELDTLRREARSMQVLWGQYLVEKSTWATYGRVHEIAERGLGMRTPEANDIVILKVRP